MRLKNKKKIELPKSTFIDIETFKTKEQLIQGNIDSKKAEIIEFLIDHEGLTQCEKTDHFYYWFVKDEHVLVHILSDFHKTLLQVKDSKSPINIKLNDKIYNLNSFSDIKEIVFNNSYELCINFFTGSGFDLTRFYKKEYFLRYSPKFNTLEYFITDNKFRIQRSKKGNFFYKLENIKSIVFKINQHNNVLIKRGRMFNYISTKNVFFVGNTNSNYKLRNHKLKNEDYWTFVLMWGVNRYQLFINQKLLAIHLKSDFIKEFSVEEFNNFIDRVRVFGNKYFKKIDSKSEILLKITKNQPIPKILLKKFKLEELIELIILLNYNDLSKFIQFSQEIQKNTLVYDEYNELINGNNYSVILTILGYLLYSKIIKKESMISKLEQLLKEYQELDIISSQVLADDDKRYYKNLAIECRDYILMCLHDQKKVNLKINSRNRLVQEHNMLSNKINIDRIPEICVAKHFPNIESDNLFFVEKIKDKKRLFLEGQNQSHCVASYAPSINTGKCCIYSFRNKESGKAYTLEIVANTSKAYKKPVLVLHQCRSKFNENPEPIVLENILQILKKYDIEPVNYLKKQPIYNHNEFQMEIAADGDLPF